MNVLRQLWHDAQTVLRDMSTNQRVAAAFLLLTIAIWLTAAAWLGSSSGEVAKRPLPLEVEPGDINDILGRLNAKGVSSAEYDFESRRILVNAADEKKAVIAMAEDGLLKGAHQFGFEQMLDKWAFSDTRLKSEESMRFARASEVARLIEALENIKEAQVIYSDDARTSLFGVAHKKSAAVRVRMKLRQKLTEEEANTIIALVSSAKAGLDERDVVVTDQTGNKFHASSRNGLSAMARQKWDTEFALNEELRRRLENLMRQYVPNIQYEGDVNAFPKHDVFFDYKEVMFKEVLPGEVGHSATRKFTQTSSRRPSEEPGVNPNVRRTANLQNSGNMMIDESRTDEKTAEKTMQNTIRETATKVAPHVTNLTVSAIIHLPYRLKRDEEGKPVQATNEAGEALTDPETNEIVWERESVEPLPPDKVEELKRQLALASGISLADVPEKIEVSQVAWMPPVHSPRGGESAAVSFLRMLNEGKVYIATLLGLAAVLLFIYFETTKQIPTDTDDSLDEESLSLSLKGEPVEEDMVDEEWENLRASLAAAVSEDPKRVAMQLRRWMRKE